MIPAWHEPASGSRRGKRGHHEAMTDAERVIRENADRIRDIIVAEILEQHDEITELAVERATTIGAREYGDKSFRKTPDELTIERFQEYADAYFYLGVELDMEGGRRE